jgi:hypothetical protein
MLEKEIVNLTVMPSMVRNVEFGLTVSRDSAAVGFSTLDCATPALGIAIASRQGGNSVTIDENCLCIVSSRVIILVCRSSFSFHSFGSFNDMYGVEVSYSA